MFSLYFFLDFAKPIDRYLYCDEIYLEADNVLATLYAAKKYIVPHLARACVNYLETSLTAKNACLLLSQSRLFEEPELMQRCWEVIDAQVSDTLDRMHLEQYIHEHGQGSGVPSGDDGPNSSAYMELRSVAAAAAAAAAAIAVVDNEPTTALTPIAIANQS